MKIKNLSLLCIAFVLASASFVSCKKEKTEVAPPVVPAETTIQGTWKGKYGSGNETPDSYFSFVIAQDGTMKVYSDKEDNSFEGTGTWTLKDNVLSGKYKYKSGFLIEYLIAAKFDAKAKTLNGSWSIGEKEQGTFTMTKQ